MKGLLWKHKPREPLVVSVAQYRPEKNHALQLHAFHRLLQLYPEHGCQPRMVLIGGCRNDADEARVQELKQLRQELQLSDTVDILVNLPYDQLLDYLSRAKIGLHTMRDEHFGIGVVEFLASGLVLAGDCCRNMTLVGYLTCMLVMQCCSVGAQECWAVV